MTGRIVTAPDVWHQGEQPAVFIAGGISNCPDWQTAVCERITEATNWVAVNPRREGWDMSAHVEESIKQITWEHMHLRVAAHIIFWFPSETLCPITLLELGKYLAADTPLTIGTHPDYGRRLDVQVQTNLERPGTKIWDSLEDMIAHWISENG